MNNDSRVVQATESSYHFLRKVEVAEETENQREMRVEKLCQETKESSYRIEGYPNKINRNEILIGFDVHRLTCKGRGGRDETIPQSRFHRSKRTSSRS